MQPWNYSEGTSAELRKVMTSIGAYTLNDTPFRSISPDPSVYATYPKAFRYIYSESGEKVFSKSTFIGPDWSGTRQGANYVSHAVHDDMFQGYPIEYQESPTLIDSIDHALVSSDVRPEPLPQADMALPAQRRVNRSSVEEFVRANGLDNVLRMLRIAVLEPGRIVIADAHDRIPFWIGALTMSLPNVLAEQISFSTFGNIPDMRTPSVVPRYTEDAGFRINLPSSIPESPVLDEYCSKVYGEPGFLSGFSDFLARCRLRDPQVSMLPEYYIMYLVSRGDGSHRRFVTDDRITEILYREPKKYEESVLYNNLKTRMESSPDETTFELYVRCRDVLTDSEHAKVLRSLYTKLMYTKLKAVSSPEAMERDVAEYGSVLENFIEEGYEPGMDTPGEVYAALRRWKDGNRDLAGLLGRARLDNGFQLFVSMMRAGKLDFTEFSSPDSVLSESIKARLASIVFTDISNMTPDEVRKLLASVFDGDMVRYGQIFEAIAGNPTFSDLVTECLSELPMRGKEYTYSDALNYCFSLENCPFTSIFKSFKTPQRDMNMSNAQVRDTVARFNDSLDTSDISNGELLICSMIVQNYDSYEEVLEEGRNRIQAAVFARSLAAGKLEPAEGWDYFPEVHEMERYVRSVGPALAEHAETDSTVALTRMFGESGEDFVRAFVGYLADNKASVSSPRPYIAAIAATLRTGCSAEVTGLALDALHANKKFRQNDVSGDLRAACTEDEMEVLRAMSGSDRGRAKMLKPEPEPKEQPAEADRPPAEKPKKGGFFSKFRK